MSLSLVLLLAPLHDAMHTAVMIIANVNVLILIVGVLKLFPYTLITQYFPFCDTPATIFFTNIVKGECNTKTKKACVFWFLGLPSRILYYTNIVKGECNPKPKKPRFWFLDCRAASFLK